jgi:hypothetical protein
MVFTDSRMKLAAVHINCFISFSYTLFLGIRLQPGFGYDLHEKKAVTFELLVHYVWLSVKLTCFMIQVFAIQHGHDFASLVNQLVNFNREAGTFPACPHKA